MEGNIWVLDDGNAGQLIETSTTCALYGKKVEQGWSVLATQPIAC